MNGIRNTNFKRRNLISLERYSTETDYFKTQVKSKVFFLKKMMR